MSDTERKFQAIQGLYTDRGIKKVPIRLLSPGPDDNTDSREEVPQPAEPLIVVRMEQEKSYRVVSGIPYFRYCLSLENPNKDLLCHLLIVSSPTVLELVSLLFAQDEKASRERRRFRIVGLFHALQKSGELQDRVLTYRISNALCVDKRYVNMYDKIYLNDVKELREAVEAPPYGKERHIPVTKAAAIADWSESEQREALQMIEQGSRPSELIEAYKDRHKINKHSPDQPFDAAPLQDAVQAQQEESQDRVIQAWIDSLKASKANRFEGLREEDQQYLGELGSLYSTYRKAKRNSSEESKKAEEVSVQMSIYDFLGVDPSS